MFLIKNKKIRYTTANPSFSICIKMGFKGVYISRTCFPDVLKVIRRNLQTKMYMHNCKMRLFCDIIGTLESWTKFTGNIKISDHIMSKTTYITVFKNAYF